MENNVTNKRLKVVLLCTYSDHRLRNHLEFPNLYWGNIVRSLMGRSNQIDFAVWDSNAISELEKHDNIEVHVITPHSGISHLHEFVNAGIYYHVFWHEYDIILEKIKRKFNIQNENAFKHNRNTIAKLIAKIKPDIIHVIGIENKFYSMAVLDVPQNIPIIAQLQTLVSDIRFKESCGISEKEYSFNSNIEKRILMRADYIGTQVKRFREIIARDIKPDAVFIDTTLAVSEPIFDEDVEKEYDFVYFAANISKAADLAIEAFGEAVKKRPSLTLDIIGGYSSELKAKLDHRIAELGISHNVTFEGKLPTHSDVIKQIRKSRFALLPLKIDLVSSTIREAMANGLPVVTTVTPATPNLNKKRMCVLLSKNGDYNAMAQNMLRLIDDGNYASELRKNGIQNASEILKNKEVVDRYVEAYFSCLKDFNNNKR